MRHSSVKLNCAHLGIPSVILATDYRYCINLYMATVLTHFCLLGSSTLISWASPFPFKGLLGGIFFPFYSNFNRTFCKQIVESLIRRRILRRLVWFCTVCRCPIKKTLNFIISWLNKILPQLRICNIVTASTSFM